MNELIIACTPFQILSAVCYLNTRGEKERKPSLLVYGGFNSAHVIAAQLSKTNMFASVLYAKTYNAALKKYAKEVILDGLFRKEHIINRVRSSCPELLKKSPFKRIVFGSANLFVHDVSQLCLDKDGTSILIDDGTGSHIGSIYSGLSFLDQIVTQGDLVREAAKTLINCITHDKLKFRVSDIYLFNPTSCETDRYKKSIIIHKLRLNDKVLKQISNCFGNLNVEYPASPVVLLTVPDDAGEEARIREGEVFATCKKHFGDDVVVRLHPRRKENIDHFKHVIVDDGQYPWELLLARGIINDNSLLIGTSSTAQITPKMMFNLEPTLIFINGIVNDSVFDTSTITAFDSEIRHRYINGKKLHRVSNIEEFERELDSFLLISN